MFFWASSSGSAADDQGTRTLVHLFYQLCLSEACFHAPQGSEVSRDHHFKSRTVSEPWFKLIKESQAGMVVHGFNPSPQKQNQVDLHEFQDSLGYIVNSRTARTM